MTSPYHNITFLKHIPEIDLEFLTNKKVLVKCYQIRRFYFIVFEESPKKRLWTEWTAYKGESVLRQVPIDKVLNSLSSSEKKEFIENWSILKNIGNQD